MSSLLYNSHKCGSLTKMKRWRNFTHDGFIPTEEIVGHAYIILHIARRNLFQVLIGLYI